MDAFVVDAALAAVKSFNLGGKGTTDLLAVSFSGTDYAGSLLQRGGCRDVHAAARARSIDRTAAGRPRQDRHPLRGRDDCGPWRHRHHGKKQTAWRRRTAARIETNLFPPKVSAALAQDLPRPAHSPSVLGPMEFANDVYLNAAIPADRRAGVLHRRSVLSQSPASGRGVHQGRADRSRAIRRARSMNGRCSERADGQRQRAALGRSDRAAQAATFRCTSCPRTWMATTPRRTAQPGGYDRRVPLVFWWKGISRLRAAGRRGNAVISRLDSGEAHRPRRFPPANSTGARCQSCQPWLRSLDMMASCFSSCSPK